MTGLEILLVEDDKATAVILREYLREARFGVRVVGTLAGARLAARESRADAILLDLGLPDSDAEATCSAIPALAEHAPVVVISGNVHLKRAALAEGAVDFISKPFDAAEILLALRHAISRRSLEGRILVIAARVQQACGLRPRAD